MDPAASDTPLLLDIRNLRVEAASAAGHRVTLVDDVSFTVRSGEVLALVGEAGASIGLSTLSYVRSGCRITGGQVVLQGTDLRGLNHHRQRILRGAKVGYIGPAAAAFNPARTILDQVCEVAVESRIMTKAQARTEALRLFRALDVPRPESFDKRYPHQVAAGSLQRAAAAMTMIAKPDLLIVDEPTAALDVTTQVEVLAALKGLIRQQDTGTLFFTRDLAIAAQVADRIAVLHEGKIAEIGAAAQVLSQPLMERTRALVAERTASEQAPPLAARSTDEAPVFEGRNLIAAYRGGGKAIDDVTIELKRGETLAVAGESGSGKSALARVVLGLLPARSGALTLNGANLPRRLRDRSKDQLRRLQMIHQVRDAALNPRQRVLEIVGRPVQFYLGKSGAEARTRVEDLLRQVELQPEDITRRPRELTGGQQLRVSLARALAAEPDVIVCDDITSGLDPLVAEALLHLLRRIQDQSGIACLFITHDLGAARRAAHKMVVMQKGKMVAAGSVEQVLSPPYHPYTELLLSSVPEMHPGWLEESLAHRRKIG